VTVAVEDPQQALDLFPTAAGRVTAAFGVDGHGEPRFFEDTRTLRLGEIELAFTARQLCRLGGEALGADPEAGPSFEEVTLLPEDAGEADLREPGELEEVLSLGVSLWEARKAGGFTYSDFRSGAHAAYPLFKRLRCKEAGFSASKIAEVEGPGAWAECRAGGSDPCGFEPRDFLKNGVSVKECCELGMSIAELVGAGVVLDFKLLKEAGFTMQECRAANVANLSLADCRRLGWTLREFLAAGVSGSECRSGGHFTAADFKESGFSFADCVAFGFSAVELAGQGFEMAGAARAV
jgi:intracellular multiplication protein IcmE